MKHARNDIERLSTEVRALREILKRLEELVNCSSVMKLSTLAVVNEQGEGMKQCTQQLAGIKDKLEASDGMKKIGLRTLKWPLKSEKIEQIIYDLERYKSAFSLTLNTDQAALAIAADAGLTQLRQDFAAAHVDDVYEVALTMAINTALAQLREDFAASRIDDRHQAALNVAVDAGLTQLRRDFADARIDNCHQAV